MLKLKKFLSDEAELDGRWSNIMANLCGPIQSFLRKLQFGPCLTWVKLVKSRFNELGWTKLV